MVSAGNVVNSVYSCNKTLGELKRGIVGILAVLRVLLQ